MSDVTRTPTTGSRAATSESGGPVNDAPTAELLRQLSQQMSSLVSKEIELAKAEVSEKGRKVGIGAGMFGGAGVMGFYALGALIATLILVLIEIGLAPWLSALIVTIVLGAIAGVLALSGKKQVEQGTPLAPEKTIASVKQDTDTIKTSAQAGRNAR